MLGFVGFADPAWDILLDLFAARAEGATVSVSSACIASGVACSTAMHWVGRLEKQKLITRRRDPFDGRRSFLELEPSTVTALERWINATFLE